MGSWLILISGVSIFVSNSLFGVLPALLLVPAGLELYANRKNSKKRLGNINR
ncbi:hypothetical protein ACFQ4A_05415 [Lentibacillus salinarum]|uniref:Uncharacterized protein n=1 Tax=Lentibacillus salinarum TaxID=446820 RepID=A0ABW3ZS69_9BACI